MTGPADMRRLVNLIAASTEIQCQHGLVMCLRFVFLLITPMTSWLRLSRREEAWKILILRHQLAVLQRRQPCRPDPDWADRALLATLLAVIPKANAGSADAGASSWTEPSSGTRLTGAGSCASTKPTITSTGRTAP